MWEGNFVASYRTKFMNVLVVTPNYSYSPFDICRSVVALPDPSGLIHHKTDNHSQLHAFLADYFSDFFVWTLGYWYELIYVNSKSSKIHCTISEQWTLLRFCTFRKRCIQCRLNEFMSAMIEVMSSVHCLSPFSWNSPPAPCSVSAFLLMYLPSYRVWSLALYWWAHSHLLRESPLGHPLLLHHLFFRAAFGLDHCLVHPYTLYAYGILPPAVH